MIVEQIMTKEVAVLAPEDSIRSAVQLMRDRKIRHLPIATGDRQLVGLVTERDIKYVTPSVLNSFQLAETLENPLSSIMTKNIITGHPLDFVEEIAVLFYNHKIGCMPIVRGKRIEGIVTSTDLLHTMVELTGAHKPGSQIEIRVEDKPGVLYEVAGIFKELKVNVQSVLVYPDSEEEGHKVLVFRVSTMNPLLMIEKLKNEGLHVLWPNMPGMPG